MDKDPDYDDLTMVRMAIVERDDRLVVLMPPGTTQEYIDQFRENSRSYGWPEDRILIMVGPEAFAVVKFPEDEVKV